MPLYEHTFLARHSLTGQQATTLAEECGAIITESGGTVLETEYWGLRSLAYRIRNNRKAHYAFLRLDAPAAAVQEMERQLRLNEDILRILTIRVDRHEEGPSAIMRAKARRDARRPRRDEEGGESKPEDATGGGARTADATGGDADAAPAPAPNTTASPETIEAEAPGAAAGTGGTPTAGGTP